MRVGSRTAFAAAVIVVFSFVLLFVCLSTTGKKSSITMQTQWPAMKRFTAMRARRPLNDDPALTPVLAAVENCGLDDKCEDSDNAAKRLGCIDIVGAKTRLIKSSRSATTAIADRNQQSPTRPCSTSVGRNLPDRLKTNPPGARLNVRIHRNCKVCFVWG